MATDTENDRHNNTQNAHPASPRKTAPGITVPLLVTSIAVALIALTNFARRWALSGAAIETLVLVYGYGTGSRIFPDMPLWTILTTFNLAYAVCSTSWLLYGLFAAACYPLITVTCLFQFDRVATFARRSLRKTLKQLHFTRDKIALFNLPALEIDTDVDGLLVARGVTISLSTLSIVVHGIELGLKLADDVELSMYADEVTVALFRRIDIGDVFGNIKGGKAEMTLATEELGEDTDDDASLFNETPLLRAATVGSEGFKDRPRLRESLTGVSWMRDSSAKDGFDIVTTLSPDDDKADQQYKKILQEIRTTSTVSSSRQQVLYDAGGKTGLDLDNDHDMRAAICAELQKLPSIAHPPSRSIRVTTLQNLSSPRVRDFLHRLPFLLRLLLTTLSYLHSVNIASINVAGSGRFTAAMLQDNIFKHHAQDNAEIRRIQKRLTQWLADASFCLQLADITAFAQVPLTTVYDVIANLRFKDIMAYRSVVEQGTIAQVVRLGGADATISVPSYLLPHHEHILPPIPTAEDEADLSFEVREADGIPQAVQAEQRLEKAQKDETAMTISVHASLPAAFDQSLLNFIAALVKATKIIELEKEVDEVESGESPMLSTTPTTPTTTNSVVSDDASIKSASSTASGFKAMTRNLRQNLVDGTTKHGIREMARELTQNTKDGMKKVLVSGMVNDRWIAKMVGKVAAKLQQAQGDIGYSGEIPLPLAPYRPQGTLPSKLLP